MLFLENKIKAQWIGPVLQRGVECRHSQNKLHLEAINSSQLMSWFVFWRWGKKWRTQRKLHRGNTFEKAHWP